MAIVLAAVCCAEAAAQRLSDLKTPTPLPPGSTLVIGFLGGYDRWSDEHRSVRRIILNMRNQPGVYAESVSNHHRRVALKLIRHALDTNRDGRLELEEKTTARIVLFGQSWGGAATIATARDLERLGIRVLLTVQVDSIGMNDGLVPPNVDAAVNFYQRDPLTIQGRGEIRAEDPARTAILGNFQETYRSRSVDESNASWPRKVLGGSHVKLEQDPAVWNRVEQYITDAIAGRRP